MNRVVNPVLAVCFVLGSLVPAWGYERQDVRVEWWTGSGPHEALLVVDFWPENAESDSFAFGCRFGAATITGLDLLNATQAAGSGFSFAGDEGFVTDMWYTKDGTTYHAGYQWPESYWSYWVSADAGENWDYSLWGPVVRVLHDGETDGWLAKPGDDETNVPLTPLARSILGDLNCNGAVDFDDINPFVLALTDGAGYYVQFPACHRFNADCNEDRHVDFEDVNPFIDRLGQ